MTTTDTIAMLCRAVDNGDDESLLILADALEEAGDRRAEGLRRVGESRPVLSVGDGHSWWTWWQENASCCPTQGQVPGKVWFRLRGMVRWRWDEGWAYYRTRHEAFLGLAAALTS